MAIEFVKNQYPIIDKNNIKIDAKLVDRANITAQEKNKKLSNPELKDKASKRRIINAITQGASVSTHGIHHLVDGLNTIDPQLTQLYDKLAKGNDVVFALEDPTRLLQMVTHANRDGMAAGYSKLVPDGDDWKIEARAQTFPVLIHEIVKGLYELISLYGLPDDKDERDDILGNVDSIESEVDDLKYGKMIFQKIREVLLDNHYDKFEEFPELIEEFLKDLYQLPENDFLTLITGLLNDQPNLTKINRIVDSVYRELKDDNTNELNEEEDSSEDNKLVKELDELETNFKKLESAVEKFIRILLYTNYGELNLEYNSKIKENYDNFYNLYNKLYKKYNKLEEVISEMENNTDEYNKLQTIYKIKERIYLKIEILEFINDDVNEFNYLEDFKLDYLKKILG